MNKIIALAILASSTVHAGPFLDLDLGTHLTDYHVHDVYPGRYLSHENPIGIVRLGYQTETYKLFGPVKASVHAYYQHMSSAKTSQDSGVDVLMLGVRFK